MPKPDIEKKNAVINFSSEEVELYQRGMADSLSSFNALSRNFDLTPGTVRKYLQQAGVTRNRIVAREERRLIGLNPSLDAAWILAVIASGGNANPINATVSLSSYDPDLLDIFKERGENEFGISASITHVSSSRPDYRKVVFYSRNLPNAMGDLRRERWPDTIVERYPWILENEEYIWSFLEGIFETSGTVSIVPEKRRITFNTNFSNVANFIADLLQRVEIEHPSVKRDRNTTEGIKGIELNRRVDVKRFAENVHSVSASREEKLAFLRGLPDMNRSFGYTTDDVLKEWRRLKHILGHSPRSNEIQDLKRKGETIFSHSVYIDRFTDNGKFVDAREAIERIIDEVSSSEEDTSYIVPPIQIFP